MFADRFFWQAFRNTLAFTGITGSPSSVRYDMVMAGAALAPVALFILLQRYFVQSVSMTGIKG